MYIDQGKTNILACQCSFSADICLFMRLQLNVLLLDMQLPSVAFLAVDSLTDFRQQFCTSG